MYGDDSRRESRRLARDCARLKGIIPVEKRATEASPVKYTVNICCVQIWEMGECSFLRRCPTIHGELLQYYKSSRQMRSRHF